MGSRNQVLILIACSFVLASCLQVATERSLPDYIPMAQPVRSGPFRISGDDLLIVSVSGAALQPSLGLEHFVLTRDNLLVPLPMPVRAGDSHVLFGFDQPLDDHYNFRLTVNPGAIQGGGAIMQVMVRAVSSGLRTNLEDTAFGDYSIRSISYGNGAFVAAGDAGKMARSTDGGRSWTSILPGHDGSRFEDTIYAVAFGGTGYLGGTRFYAVGAGARMSWSANGTDWMGYRIPPTFPLPPGPPPPPVYGQALFAGESIHAVAFGRGATSADARFVAAGGGGRTIFRWFDPGMHLWAWVVGTGIDPECEIYTVVWGATGGNGRFVAAGRGGSVYWATDGSGSQEWTRASGAGEVFGDYAVRASAFGNGVFVIGGDGGRMAWSSYGKDWYPVDVSVFGNADVLDIAFGSELFIAVGSDGVMARSVCGIDWEPVLNDGFGIGESINGIATDGRGRFVAVGNCGATGAGRIVSWYQGPLGK